ncbi:p53 and DNA damage-regulated protein 1 [Bufo gargarizans]|uniref:p53 and DNA damage-regulated protein 1 n=1 Tax=Bufo gargarizans TaxID=30331 RepID=UPI001CF48ECF|nr:p53 and DNA damage-regulated protein 1 [Bufo gargarizans]
MEQYEGPEKVLAYLQEVERKAEDVLVDRRQIVDLDIKRNQNREALRALGRDPSQSGPVTVCFGDMFINLPIDKTKEMIHRDQEQLEAEIKNLRSQLKVKVNQLYEAQGKPELKGFSLVPLDPDEIKAINKVLKG